MNDELKTTDCVISPDQYNWIGVIYTDLTKPHRPTVKHFATKDEAEAWIRLVNQEMLDEEGFGIDEGYIAYTHMSFASSA